MASTASDVEDSADRRNAVRRPMEISITIRERNWNRQPAALHDISLTGCKIGYLTLRAGEIVWVRLAGIEPLQATVSWSTSRECGLRFDQPLHPAVLDHVEREVAKAARA